MGKQAGSCILGFRDIHTPLAADRAARACYEAVDRVLLGNRLEEVFKPLTGTNTSLTTQKIGNKAIARRSGPQTSSATYCYLSARPRAATPAQLPPRLSRPAEADGTT